MNNIIGSIPALLLMGLVLLVFVFWIMMLIDAIKNPRLTSNERIVWVIVIVFLNWLGASIYLLAGRNK